MATPKGKIGYPILGDSSLEFYRNVPLYINSRIEEYGARIFQSRILNKPTVFVCSCSAVKELLTEHHTKMSLGYKAMLHHLYGDNIMFEEATEADRLHALMHHVFIQNALPNFDRIVQKFIQRHFSNLHSSDSVQVYETFKLFATELMLALFLDLDATDSPDLVHDVASLATTHWHGVISVPLNWKVSYWSSSCKQAVESKDKLLELIRTRLASQADKGSFLTRARQAGFKDQSELEHHILPFVSALVPKAIASLLTSFTLALCSKSKDNMQVIARESSDYLEYCLLETERLWPPVLGGRRLVREDFILDGYKVPKGYAVIYVSSIAHRDPDVFKNPNTFDPTRWADNSKEKEKLLFCYGDGPRCCVGTSLMKNLIKKVSQYLVGHYNWTLGEQDEDLDYKWLPMARPKELSVSFTKVDQSEALSEPTGKE
ncbi:beta-amyrin 28-monooxygenase-like [Lytechinus variegatus]|uniref:beta-amyrin 28-monooxygenase-like n=1 Tax=Lytechinus variegatus TaxID=7654 RepID=UPI001BB17FC5|nr:beta-amyrin 28-monooxygenase-like [Lytechinus variegatus]